MGWPLNKYQIYKTVKHNQIVSLQKPTNFVSVFDHIVGLALGTSN